MIWPGNVRVGDVVGSASQQYTVEMVDAGVRKAVTFTARQMEILRLLVRGFSPSQAARNLGISRRTVEHHLEKARERTGIETTTQLLLKVAEAGLTPEQRPVQPGAVGG